MNESLVIHNTFVIERAYPKSPEMVFAAWAEPAKKRRWYAANSEGHDIEAYEMEFRVGGMERYRFRMNATTPFPGVILANEGYYLDIVPNQRLVEASAMTLGGRRISVSQVTVELVPKGEGTNLILTHQGVFFENSGGPQMREGGWQRLLERLAAELA